jgi:hypothetical protein
MMMNLIRLPTTVLLPADPSQSKTQARSKIAE